MLLYKPLSLTLLSHATRMENICLPFMIQFIFLFMQIPRTLIYIVFLVAQKNVMK